MRLTLVALSNGIDLQKYAANVARELARQYEVSLITTRWFEKSLVPSHVSHYPVGLTRTPRLEPQLFNPIALVRLVRALRRSRPDIVHFTSAHPLHLAMAKFAGQTWKVFTIHDPVPHPNEPVSRFVEMYNRIVFSGLADRIVLHGRSHFNTLTQLGVDVRRCRYAPLGEIDGSQGDLPYPGNPSMLFFGRIRPYKGLEVFLRAAAIVVERLPQTRIVIAGQGDLAPYQDLLNLPNLELRNEFIPDSDEAKYFSQAQVVVLPYTSATQSGVIPVAYSYARPVIATEVGSIPEMVVDGETGYLVPPGDWEALASKCIKILSNPELGRIMGEKAREFFRLNLTPAAMARHFHEIYLELLTNSVLRRS